MGSSPRSAGAMLAAAALLAACASTTPGGVRIDTAHTAQGQDSRALFLVLHYTVGDLASSLRVLTQGDVSAHYLVSDETPPRIYRLVGEDRRAWHAGHSAWQGHRQLNAASIGVEIVNAGPTATPAGPAFAPYPVAQIDALLPLLRDIIQRHAIRPDRVLGHSDVQPQNKLDPGPMFPWQRLAEAGLVIWPEAGRVAAQRPLFDAMLPDVAWFQQRLAAVGYDVETHGRLDAATRKVIAAFQMKYRQALHDGQPDAETAALLQVLTDSGR